MNDAGAQSGRKYLVLFDVDGTLAPSGQRCCAEVHAMLRGLCAAPNIDVGVVGGGTLAKIRYQLSTGNDDDGASPPPAPPALLLRWLFAENGLVTGDGVQHAAVRTHVPEADIQRVVSSCLRWIADADLPSKRGAFVDFRAGLIYVTPIGSQCTSDERTAFAAHDAQYGVRRALIAHLRAECHDRFEIALGGQIGVAIMPRGWNKTYCLRHIDASGERYEAIFFVGDRVSPDGNDYPLYASPRTVGFATTGPAHTLRIVAEHILPRTQAAAAAML